VQKYKIIPKIVITDFEYSLFTSILNVFVSVDHCFCLFHYAQALYHKIVAIGYGVKYKTTLKFNMIFRKFICHPFFPINRLIVAFEELEK
jgi:hypothetical protein